MNLEKFPMLICGSCGCQIEQAIDFCPQCGTSSEFFKTMNSASEVPGESDKKQITIKNTSELKKGELVDDRFEVISKTGYTLICPVYRVFDRERQTDKSLTILPSIICDNIEAMDFLSQEIKTKTWIKHPNIVSVLSFKKNGPVKYVETEFATGESLAFIKLNSARKRLSETGIRKIIPRVVKALAYAHDNNILHRNLKPQNILLTPGGIVKVKDFGLTDSIRNAINMVQDYSARDSLLYMSPEQIRGRNLGVYSDIYSLGATIYDLLSGHPPFFRGDIYNQIIHEEPEKIPWISDQMNALIKKCMAKDPSVRFSQYDDLLTEISRMAPVRKSDTKIIPDSDFEERRQKIAEEQRLQTEKFERESEPGFKSGTKIYAAIIAAIFIVIVGMAIYNSDQLPWEKARDEMTREEAWQEMTDADKQRLDYLLDRADTQFKNKKLIKPPGDNAYELYLEALTILPQDKYSWNQIDLIRKDFVEKSREMIEELDFREAEYNIRLGLKYFPSDSELVNILRQTNQFIIEEERTEPLKIQVLNGAGFGGLAGDFARRLGYMLNYKVVDVDNFRENGTLRWDVPKTKIISHFGKNIRVRRLAKELGIESVSSDSLVSDSINISIIIGKDYRDLPIYLEELAITPTTNAQN